MGQTYKRVPYLRTGPCIQQAVRTRIPSLIIPGTWYLYSSSTYLVVATYCWSCCVLLLIDKINKTEFTSVPCDHEATSRHLPPSLLAWSTRTTSQPPPPHPPPHPPRALTPSLTSSPRPEHNHLLLQERVGLLQVGSQARLGRRHGHLTSRFNHHLRSSD